MDNQAKKTKNSPSKINPFKDYFELDTKENDPLQNSISYFSKEYFGNKIGEKDSKETAIEAKIYKELNEENYPKRKLSIYISSKEVKKIKLEQSLREQGILTSETENHLILRKMPEIPEKKYKEIKNKLLDKNTFNNLYDQLQKVNIEFKDPECHISIGGISPLSYLIKKNYKFDKQKEKEMKDKFKILEPYVYNFRTIFGDGNCFYRAVMFRYLEILVLGKKIDILKKVVIDVMESFKSEELQKRKIIINKDIEPELTFKLLFLIIDLLEKDNIMEAYKILFKCFSTCRKFDYAIILYFRYILYDYIRKNENKIYLESFPISIGNLLPSQYETDNGDFLFKEFYENYLLKFYTDAEKIIVYLAPFVLGIEINVVVYDIESDIFQKFIFEGKSEIKTDEIISLINKRNHYEIIYNKNDEEKNKKFFEIFENNMERNISFSEETMDNNDDDNDFRLLKTFTDIDINKEINSQEQNNNNIKENNNDKNNQNNNKNDKINNNIINSEMKNNNINNEENNDKNKKKQEKNDNKGINEIFKKDGNNKIDDKEKNINKEDSDKNEKSKINNDEINKKDEKQNINSEKNKINNNEKIKNNEKEKSIINQKVEIKKDDKEKNKIDKNEKNKINNINEKNKNEKNINNNINGINKIDKNKNNNINEKNKIDKNEKNKNEVHHSKINENINNIHKNNLNPVNNNINDSNKKNKNIINNDINNQVNSSSNLKNKLAIFDINKNNNIQLKPINKNNLKNINYSIEEQNKNIKNNKIKVINEQTKNKKEEQNNTKKNGKRKKSKKKSGERENNNNKINIVNLEFKINNNQGKDNTKVNKKKK